MFEKRRLSRHLKLFKNNQYNKILSDCCIDGASLFVYGGYIRDRLFRVPFFDVDYLLFGMDITEFYEALKECLPNHKIELTDSGKGLILYAKLFKSITSLDIQVVSASDIHSFLLSADVSINSFAYQINSDESKLLDPSNGLKDYKSRVLRHVSENNIPKTILRNLKYIIKHNLKPDKKTFELFQQYKAQIPNLFNERYFRYELKKYFRMEKCGSILQYLDKYDFLVYIFPFLDTKISYQSVIKQIHNLEKNIRYLDKESLDILFKDDKKIYLLLKLTALIEFHLKKNPLSEDDIFDFFDQIKFLQDDIDFIKNILNNSNQQKKVSKRALKSQINKHNDHLALMFYELSKY